jgi:hypothetical protein
MSWTDGLDEATIGHAKLNGWQTDGNPEEIARAAVQAHLTAQNVLKAPAGEFLRSTDTDALYAALGAAKDPKEYVFDQVKFKDGTPVDDVLAGVLRGTAHSLRLSPTAAQQLAESVVKWAEEAEDAEAGDRTTKRTSEDLDLRRSWAGNYDAFKADADRAAALLGLAPDDVEALFNTKLGYTGTYEKLRNLSIRLGESKFLSGERSGNDQFKPMSREEAIAKRAEFMNDPAKIKDFHTKENQAYLLHLNRQIVGMPA